MITGIGTDIIEISRVARSAKNPRFIERVYSREERVYFKTSTPAATMAMHFAAKEAFGKALGLGVRGFSWNEVSVMRDGLGKPYYKLSGRAAKLAGNKKLFLTLSDTETLAVASAVAEI